MACRVVGKFFPLTGDRIRGGGEEAQKGLWSLNRVPQMKVDQTEASGSSFLGGPKNGIFWDLFSGCFMSSFRMQVLLKERMNIHANLLSGCIVSIFRMRMQFELEVGIQNQCQRRS